MARPALTFGGALREWKRLEAATLCGKCPRFAVPVPLRCAGKVPVPLALGCGCAQRACPASERGWRKVPVPFAKGRTAREAEEGACPVSGKVPVPFWKMSPSGRALLEELDSGKVPVPLGGRREVPLPGDPGACPLPEARRQNDQSRRPPLAPSVSRWKAEMARSRRRSDRTSGGRCRSRRRRAAHLVSDVVARQSAEATGLPRARPCQMVRSASAGRGATSLSAASRTPAPPA